MLQIPSSSQHRMGKMQHNIMIYRCDIINLLLEPNKILHEKHHYFLKYPITINSLAITHLIENRVTCLAANILPARQYKMHFYIDNFGQLTLLIVILTLISLTNYI